MAEISKHQVTLSGLQTKVVIISADEPKQSRSFKAEKSFLFTVLCDSDRKVIKQFNLLNPYEHAGIAYPAIFIIKPGGIVGYRSLDRTASRVDLTEVLNYLKTVNVNPDHTLRSESKKNVIIPKRSDLWQLTKNMFGRGNLEDWKHYIGYPLVLLRLLFRKKKV